MAARFKPFLSRHIGKIALTALITGTVISQQQCQRRIKEVKRREEEYWRKEVEELMRDAEHRGRMDELRRMTEYMVTPTETPGSSMKGSKAMEYNQPKLITRLPDQKKSRLQNLMRKQLNINDKNEKEENINKDINDKESKDIQNDKSLEKMEKAVEEFENKIKLSALNLTDKNKNKNEKEKKKDEKIPKVNIEEKKNKEIKTEKTTEEKKSNNNISNVDLNQNNPIKSTNVLVSTNETKINENNSNNGNKNWLSWLIPMDTSNKETTNTKEIKNPNIKE